MNLSLPQCQTDAGVGPKWVVGVRVPEFWFPPEAKGKPAGESTEFKGESAELTGKSAELKGKSEK